MIGFLIKAFYESHGDFDGMEKTSFFPNVVKAAAVSKLPLVEFCYRKLGYSFDNMYSAEYRASIRKEACSSQSLDTLKARFSVPKNREILPILKTYGFLPSFSKEAVKVKDSPLARLVAAYIESTEHLTMYRMEDNSNVPLANFFASLKFYQDFAKLKRAIPNYAEFVEKILAGVVVRESVKESCVVDGVIMTNKPFDAKILANEVCLHIGCRHFTMPPKHYYTLVSKLPFYQVNSCLNTSVYLSMLDLASVYGVPLKYLVESLGIRFVDQLQVFEETGVFIYQVTDSVFEVVNPLGEESVSAKLDIVQLSNLYTSDALRYIGMGGD